MTVGRISTICWAVFVVMSVAFLPLGYVIMHIHAIPAGPRLALTILVVAFLWWGPFVYAMYLSMTVMRNGDRRLPGGRVRLGGATGLQVHAAGHHPRPAPLRDHLPDLC